MNRTTVPEATIKKNSQSFFLENEIRIDPASVNTNLKMPSPAFYPETPHGFQEGDFSAFVSTGLHPGHDL